MFLDKNLEATFHQVLLLFRSQQWKHSKKVWNLFKVKNKHQDYIKDVVLVSLLLTLKKFYTLFWCFYCWLWTMKCRLDSLLLGRWNNDQKDLFRSVGPEKPFLKYSISQNSEGTPAPECLFNKVSKPQLQLYWRGLRYSYFINPVSFAKFF